MVCYVFLLFLDRNCEIQLTICTNFQFIYFVLVLEETILTEHVVLAYKVD